MSASYCNGFWSCTTHPRGCREVRKRARKTCLGREKQEDFFTETSFGLGTKVFDTAVTSYFPRGKWLLPSKEIVDILNQRNSLPSLLSTEPIWFLTDFQEELGSGVDGEAAAGLEEGQEPGTHTWSRTASLLVLP